MLHTDLPIYKKGYDLLSLAADVQLNMPRTFKQSLGKRVHDECVELLLEIGYANASRGAARCVAERSTKRSAASNPPMATASSRPPTATSACCARQHTVTTIAHCWPTRCAAVATASNPTSPKPIDTGALLHES